MKASTKLTTVEIARLSGLSRATISAILNGKEGVSSRARQKVQAILRQHVAIPRTAQAQAAAQFSRLIVVEVRDIANPFFTEVIAGVMETLSGENYHVIFHSTRESYEQELDALAKLERLGLAGLILFPIQEEHAHDHLRRMMDEGVSLVTIGPVPDVPTYRVDVRDRDGGRMAADYLIAKGHERLACLAGPHTSTSARERVLGFIDSLLAHRLSFDQSLVFYAGSDAEGGYEAALKALRQPAPYRPTALACFSDLVAMGVYRAAHELGLKIPEQVAVIGFDGIAMGQVMGPPLTTISIQPHNLGCKAAEMLLEIMNDASPAPPRTIILDPILIERASA